MRVHRSFIGLIICSYFVKGSPHTTGIVEPFSTEFWVDFFISVFLVSIAGICSGLTVGYLSIKKQTLIIWLDSPDESLVRTAKKILQILENHHLLLSTLLLTNALAMEALPIFLDKLVPAYLAVLISTACVLIFGQVIPQAYCTGPSQIKIAYTMAPFVKFLQLLFGIFVRPITWFLDNWLGHHEDNMSMNKESLKTLLQLHNSKDLGYSPEEIVMLQNTLDLRTKSVEQCMVPFKNIFMLDYDTIVDETLAKTLKSYNVSLIPVYSGERERLQGVFRVKQLLGVDITKGLRLRDVIHLQPVIYVPEGRNMLDILDMLKSKKHRVCFVIKQDSKGKYYTFADLPAGAKTLGMISLKRTLEQVIKKQFGDHDLHKSIRSGEFGILLKKPNQNQEIVEGVEQD